MPTVAFVTRQGLGLPADDLHAAAELEARGVVVEPAVWDDTTVPWARYDAVVLRSCWDYHLRPAEFRGWIDRMERQRVPLWNPPALVRWNIEKRYLRDLAARGVPMVPTRWVEPGESVALPDLLAEEGWDEAVIKPVVSASAHATWRTRLPVAPEDALRFREASRHTALMVQPFLRAITDDGEWSLCFFGGRYSHAVRKSPARGDFRVQIEHGGRTRAAIAPPSTVEQARLALAAVPTSPLYARVDGTWVDGVLRIIELELIEPCLFLGCDAAAPGRFADAIAAVAEAGADAA